MYKYLKNVSFVIILAVCVISCSPANNKPVSINFSRDSSRILFSRVSSAGLLDLKNTPGFDTSYTNILSVVQLPTEDDSTGIERIFPGKVTVLDSVIVYIPEKPFVRGTSYLVVSYLNARFGDAALMLTGKLDHKVKSSQVVLKR